MKLSILAVSGLALLFTNAALADDLPLTEEGTMLQLGEYNCSSADGKVPDALSFIAASDTDYTDMTGANPGHIEISGGLIKFSGGQMDGLTGSNLTPTREFELSNGGKCLPW
jgi:hypothetical protein